ncbi:hypothetical protein A9Q99_06370 [Gammaproteobacteria bacterium 45_16_T64]|nr:hypothetical protein A9Q99_06370 [Gammaproteobacteria bacterium 45_16_T64]
MDNTFVEFIHALRGADVRVSTAEALDAMQVLQLVGYHNRSALKLALGQALAKSEEEKHSFNACFDHYFQFTSMDSLKEHTETALKEMESQQSEQTPSLISNILSGDMLAAMSQITNPQPSSPLEAAQSETPLGQLLLSGDQAAAAMAIASAGQSTNASQIQVMTQKGLYGRRMMMAMGLEAMEEEIWQAELSGNINHQLLAQQLRSARDVLRSEVKDYIERQFVLQAKAKGKQLRQETMMSVRLEHLREFKDTQVLVRKLAKRLAKKHAQRKKVHNRGQLDVRSTLRLSIPHGGIMFNPQWRSKRTNRPKVFVICDVSGSVSQVARFLLMFLYSLADVLPKVRAFAFSSQLGEVTELFQQLELDDAIDETLDRYGNGSTNYGQAFLDFNDHCLRDVDSKTTVIILGDARNNYGDAEIESLREIKQRCHQLIWLNPEQRSRWGSGDSEMKRYHAHCTLAEVCNSLSHLERAIDKLLIRQ